VLVQQAAAYIEINLQHLCTYPVTHTIDRYLLGLA